MISFYWASTTKRNLAAGHLANSVPYRQIRQYTGIRTRVNIRKYFAASMTYNGRLHVSPVFELKVELGQFFPPVVRRVLPQQMTSTEITLGDA